jgi:hypothetical protein
MVDQIEILARSLIVCARESAINISPVRFQGFGFAHVLDVANIQLV